MASPQGRFSGTVSDFNPSQLVDQTAITPDGEIVVAPSRALSTDPASRDLLALETGPFAQRTTEVRDGAIQRVLPEYLNADRDQDYPSEGLQQGFFGSGRGAPRVGGYE